MCVCVCFECCMCALKGLGDDTNNSFTQKLFPTTHTHTLSLTYIHIHTNEQNKH